MYDDIPEGFFVLGQRQAGITFTPWSETPVPVDEPKDDDIKRIEKLREEYLKTLKEEEQAKREKYAAFTDIEESTTRVQRILAESYRATGDTPPVDLSYEPTTEELAMPRGKRPTMYNRETGQFEEVDPKYSDLELGVPLGLPRSGGGDPRTEGGGTIFDATPWQDRGANIARPKLYASNEPGVPAGHTFSDIPEGFSPVVEARGYSDIPEGFSIASSQPSWRKDIMSELDKNLATKRLVMQMLETEGGGVATLEALANRTAMIREKIPDWTIGKELTSGFYGPINRGHAQRIHLSPQSIERHQQDIDEVAAGSNVIKGRTDQGWVGDPNWQGPGRVSVSGNKDIYNYWTGRRNGVDFSYADSARFADAGSDSAKRAVIESRNASYNDIPEGFSVQSGGGTYNDIPEGFSVDFQPYSDKPEQKYDTKLTPRGDVRDKLYPGEDKYFREHPEVTGMAAEDDKVILNPYSPADVNKEAVVKNEGFRIKLRKEGVTPDFEVTEEQKSAFKGTEYEKDENSLKQTIAARIYSGDPSAKATLEQEAWVQRFTQPKREVGAIESGYRAAKSSMLGLSEFVSRHGIAPFVHGVRQAIEAVEPDSPLSKFIQRADDKFWKTFVSETEKQREDLAFDPGTEVRTLAGKKGKAAEFAGEAAEAVGGIIPDIGAAVVTGGAIPASSGLVAGLRRSAGIFTLPAARNGMDAARRVEKNGGSIADQAKAFIRAMAQTQAVAAVPMNVESKLATIPARIASRTAQGGALGVATGEAFRQGENLLGDKRDFELKRAAIDALVPGILGGAFGRNTSVPREVALFNPLETAKRSESAPGVYRTSEKTPRHPSDKLIGESSVEVGGQTKYTYTWISSEKAAPVKEKQANATEVDDTKPTGPIKPEDVKVSASAIMASDGTVFTAGLHPLIIEMVDNAKLPKGTTYTQGFITKDGRFLTRDEAYAAKEEGAKIAGVIPQKIVSYDYGTGKTVESKPLGIVANPKAAQGAAMLGKALQGAKKPSGRPSILPVYRGDAFRLYEGTADVLEKSGFTELGAKLRDYVDNRRKHSGHLDNQFRTWGKGMSSNQIKAAEGEFSKYWEAADKGDMTEAGKAYQAASPKGKQAIDTWKKVSGDAAGLARKAGFQIFDGKQWKPFKARENFFPRRIKPEWRNVLRNPEKHPEQYEALKREAIAKGMVKNGAEFDKRVDSALESSGPNKIATVERSRNAELPTQVYDYGFETVRNYIAAFSDAIAKTEAFGQAKGKNLAPAFKKAQELARDDYSKNYINKVEKGVNPDIDPDAWVAQLARGISTGSFLGNIRSSMRNLTSGAMFNLQHHGLREGTRSIMKAGRAAKEIDNAYEKGILHSDLANMMTNDVTNAGQWVNKLTNKVLTWSGYKTVEEWTRALALIGAKVRLRSAIREAQENPTSKAAVNNSAYFKRLGVDPVALLDEAGEGPLTDRFLRSSVAEIQGGYGIDQTPLFLQSEAGKTVFHLQKWGTQALRHFDRNVVNPALQTIKLGRKEFVNIRDKDGNIIESRVPGSVRPLARYILLAAAFGLGQQEAEEWIFGIPDKEASFAEIMMRMDDDALDALGMLAHKLYSASLSVGALGTLGGYAKTLEVAGFENALTPPPLQILSNAKDFITKWMDQGQITAGNVRDVLSTQISGIRTTGQMLARANVFGKDYPYLEMIRKKQELTWMRSTIRRFEDDVGYKRKPFGGDKRANPMTPFYADIEEKLLIGDASGARKAIRDHFKGMDPAKEKLGMEGLKKSVLGNRPIRAGGSSGEARRENFLAWTKKRLPKEDQIRIKQIDDTYRNTAIRVELMDPKPVSFEKMQEDMRNLKLRNELLSGE